MRIIRGGVQVATYLDMDVEVLEMTVADGSSVHGQRICDLHLPKEVLIAAVVRGRHVDDRPGSHGPAVPGPPRGLRPSQSGRRSPQAIRVRAAADPPARRGSTGKRTRSRAGTGLALWASAWASLACGLGLVLSGLVGLADRAPAVALLALGVGCSAAAGLWVRGCTSPRIHRRGPSSQPPAAPGSR